MLTKHLTTLEAADLIRVAQIEPELEYLFRHALFQDAAYDSLLRTDRKRLHHAVGHALEHLYADRRSEIAAELARHFEQGDDPTHALEYYRIAADHNAAQYALPEAIEQYCRAIELIRAIGQDQIDLLKQLFLKRGRLQELIGDYHAAMEGYDEMEEFAEQIDDEPLLLAALMAKSILFATGNPLHDTDQAMVVGEWALEMARSTGDRAAEARSLWILSLAHYYGRSDLAAASEIGEQALALARQERLVEQIAYSLGDLAAVYSISGKLPEARAYVAETIEIWEAEDNLPMLAHNLVTAARLAEMAGDLTEALRLSEDALLIAETVGNTESVVQALLVKIMVHVIRGEISTAMLVNEQIQMEGGVFGVPATVMALVFPLRIYAEIGLTDKTREMLALLPDSMTFAKLRPGAAAYALTSWVRAEAAVGEAGHGTAMLEQLGINTAQSPSQQFPMLEIHLMRGEFDQVLASVEDYLRSVWWMGHRVNLWDGLRVKAKALIALNRLDEAWGVLHMAREDAEGMDAKLYLWQIHSLLAEVEMKLGHVSEAADERDSAIFYTEQLADSIEDSDLHRAFLENAINTALLRSAE